MPGPIVAESLVKVYGGKVTAVDDVSFEVHAGEAFGFLGPNGAGKTTTVSMLSAGLRPTRGERRSTGWTSSAPRKRSSVASA